MDYFATVTFDYYSNYACRTLLSPKKNRIVSDVTNFPEISFSLKSHDIDMMTVTLMLSATVAPLRTHGGRGGS